MGRRIPEPYTVVITRTGKPSIQWSVWPATLLVGVVLVSGWVGIALYRFYTHAIEAARGDGQILTEQASDLLERVDTLEAELKDLTKRAGIKEEKIPKRSTADQGGIAIEPSAEELLEATHERLVALASFKQKVMPTVGEFVARRDARPDGMPLLTSVRFSSYYGLRPNPFGSSYEFHPGIDMAVAYGTPIYATAPGTVLEANFAGGYGNRVLIDHGYELKTLYGHMSKMAVTAGTRVKRGQLIGYVGSTGRSSGPHLHYGVYFQGKTVDPKPYLTAPE
jgi:murein DD-endopeptidase MepM/ murein hydrolase activator NlpD